MNDPKQLILAKKYSKFVLSGTNFDFQISQKL